MDEYLSAPQAAKQIGMEYHTLRHHLEKGNLVSHRLGPHYAIHVDDLRRFKASYDAGKFAPGRSVNNELARLEKITREIDALQAKRSELAARLNGAQS